MNFNDLEIEWLGHATVRIKTSTNVIYIDPYILDESPEKADLILITHSHYDHFDIGKINQIKQEDTEIIATSDSKEKISEIKPVNPGDKIKVKDVEISATPAYNIGKNFHPKENNWVGYILNLNEKKVYHAGDTDVIPEMEDLDVDIALLPIGGTYTMNQTEAIEAVKRINPKIVVPIHFGEVEGTRADPEKFKEEVERETDSRVEIL